MIGTRSGVPMIRAFCVAESFNSILENSDQMTLFVNIAVLAINDLKDIQTVVFGAERFVFEFKSRGILGGGLCPVKNKIALLKMNVS